MNLIWDFDGTIFDTYPRILNAFDSVINVRYRLGVPRAQLEDLVFVDTKHCARTIAEQHHLDFESLLGEVRSYYDEHGEEETVFPCLAKEDGFRNKPDPESFEYLMAKYNLDKSETIGIGDRDIDVGAARNAKITSILISVRSDIQADFRIERTEELGAILTRLAGSRQSSATQTTLESKIP